MYQNSIQEETWWKRNRCGITNDLYTVIVDVCCVSTRNCPNFLARAQRLQNRKLEVARKLSPARYVPSGNAKSLGTLWFSGSLVR